MTCDIFVSYRRQESLAEARALYERLRSEFGVGSVFIDLEGLDYGVDFVESLNEQLKSCRVVLALIGPGWFGEGLPGGRRRLDDENDFVRIELRTALARSIRVVPVLVNGAPMPTSDQLPDDLRPLVRRHALELDFRRFDADMGRLVLELRRLLGPGSPAVQTPPQPAERYEPAGPTDAGARGDDAPKPLVRRLRPLHMAALAGAAIAVLAAIWFPTRDPRPEPAGRPDVLAARPAAPAARSMPPVASAAAAAADGGNRSARAEPRPAAPAASAGAGPAAVLPAAEADVRIVRIGHVAPTSGPVALVGKDNENGARMAVDELNARGLRIGGSRVRFELLAEDDAGNPKQAVAVAQKLVGLRVSGVVGHLNSVTSVPASVIYQQAGIPQLTPSATNSRLTRQGFRTTFRLIAEDEQVARAMARHLYRSMGLRRIAIVDDRSAYGGGSADAFAAEWTALGGLTTGHEYTSEKATDFTAVLMAVKAQRAQAVFVGTVAGTAGPLIKQARELGLGAKVAGGSAICTADLPKLAGGTLTDDQVICGEPGGFDQADPAAARRVQQFRADFKRRFGADARTYAPYVYDAVNLLARSMAEAGSTDPADFLPRLAATRGYAGVSGAISFDERGDLKNGAVTLRTYRGEQRVELAVVR